MVRYEFFLASALEKVFPHRRPAVMEPGSTLSTFKGQKCAVQLVYTAHNGDPNMPLQQYRIEIQGAPGRARLRSVELMPANLACYENSDDYYISKLPGLFPDLLQEMETPEVLPLPRQYRSVWLTFDIPEDAARKARFSTCPSPSGSAGHPCRIRNCCIPNGSTRTA